MLLLPLQLALTLPHTLTSECETNDVQGAYPWPLICLIVSVGPRLLIQLVFIAALIASAWPRR
jgi:hypothetical protein